jgi:uncharacterized membrane protein YfcA
VALVLVSLVGVAVGSAVGQYVPEELLRKAAAVAFILIGVLMLWGKM